MQYQPTLQIQNLAKEVKVMYERGYKQEAAAHHTLLATMLNAELALNNQSPEECENWRQWIAKASGQPASTFHAPDGLPF